MSYTQTKVSGLASGETAYSFTDEPCKDEVVAITVQTVPQFDDAEHLVALAVVVTGRWIDAKGNAKTFADGKPVKARLPRTCHDAPDPGAVVAFFLEGDSAATPEPIPAPMRGVIQLAQAAGVS